MAGSAADAPEPLRASDAERDHAINELRQEFAEGRLSHETFMLRMQTALGARDRGQLAGLFTDLPPRRPWLLDRVRAAFLFRARSAPDPSADWPRGAQVLPGQQEIPREPGEHGVPAPLVFPPGSGTSFTIGRTHDCDLRITDMSVSRRHAQLSRADDGWLLSDLGSHNGTRVNGWLVREPVPVRAGDLLQFGSAAFVVRDDAARQTPPW